MAMTASRRNMYQRKSLLREMKEDARKRRKEYNRKVRYAKVTEDSCSRGFVKNLMRIELDTIS